MKRQNTVIAMLIATAMLMGGGLAFIPTSHTVYGDMQASNAEYLLMTARAVDNGDDSVIVLENRTAKLLTYQFRPDGNGGGRLLLTNPVDLSKIGKPQP